MDEMAFSHVPVMLEETVGLLNIKPSGIYVDGTLGGGGHSRHIAEQLTTGRLICIDRDIEAINASKARLSEYKDKITFVHSNFSEISEILESLSIEHIDGMMMDLGVSSYQLDNPERGFSYMADAPLDMRMNESDVLTAHAVVNGYEYSQLKKILFDYGEESFAPQIASAIVKARENEEIASTLQLVDIIKSALPKKVLSGGHHPAKRSFQAIRIEVNRELSAIAPTIEAAADKLGDGGRIAVITFHSLEDRIVKQSFSSLANPCTCPPDFPICVCGKKPILDVITKKPVLPSEAETEINPRARSAKLRAAEKHKER